MIQLKEIRHYFLISFYLISCIGLHTACYDEKSLIDTEDDLIRISNREYFTENIIILIIDGPRQSETWENPIHQYIPKMSNELAPIGVVSNNFYNLGSTYTVPGHIAVTTGSYNHLSNTGEDYPSGASFFQMWLKLSGKVNTKAWLVTSKEKLNVLADCRDIEWRSRYNPSVDTENRNDKLTLQTAFGVMTDFEPNLLLVHFRGPDHYGHRNEWNNYLNAIVETDSLTFELWRYIQNDNFYKDKTTMFVTNDHGRHLDNIANGFVGHGDGCIGCSHINFYAVGPDFKQNIISSTKRESIDILPTIGILLGFHHTDMRGDVMQELFK